MRWFERRWLGSLAGISMFLAGIIGRADYPIPSFGLGIGRGHKNRRLATVRRL
jgi:hypothetical protein